MPLCDNHIGHTRLPRWYVPFLIFPVSYIELLAKPKIQLIGNIAHLSSNSEIFLGFPLQSSTIPSYDPLFETHRSRPHLSNLSSVITSQAGRRGGAGGVGAPCMVHFPYARARKAPPI